MSEVCYVSPEAPSFSLSIRLGDAKNKTRVKFVNKQLRLDEERDADLIAALDALIAKSAPVRTQMYKVDVVAAEKLAREHQGQLLRMRGTVQGPVSADDAKRATEMAIAERDADLVSQGADISDVEKMRDEMSKSGLEMTENSKGVVAAPTTEGFVADPSPEPVPKEDAIIEAKNVFANLGEKK